VSKKTYFYNLVAAIFSIRDQVITVMNILVISKMCLLLNGRTLYKNKKLKKEFIIFYLKMGLNFMNAQFLNHKINHIKENLY
jgi:hypothetical protein